MTTKEKIQEKIQKQTKRYKRSRIISFIILTLLFGLFMLYWQTMAYNEGELLTNDKDYVSQEILSDNISYWIYDNYSYLESISPILSSTVRIVSSILFSMIMMYLYMLSLGNFRYYYDEFNISFAFNGMTLPTNEDLIKSFRVFGYEDIDDEFCKIKINTYELTGKRGLDEFKVEKWKVTDKVNKWKIF